MHSGHTKSDPRIASNVIVKVGKKEVGFSAIASAALSTTLSSRWQNKGAKQTTE